MAPSFLRRSSTKQQSANGVPDALRSGSIKISPEERERMKQRTANIADPILSAMTEEQPFQVVNNHAGDTSVSPELHVRDIFGSPIEDPDLSNPTRHRSERPLDTIRGFEFAATGDKHIKEQIFRERLPWEGRRYTPPANNNNGGQNGTGGYANGYSGNGNENDQQAYDDYGNPIQSENTAPARTPIQLGNAGADVDYSPAPPAKEKKKRGLFGRKKKD
ncbi:uncharacterized protein V1516DRAFT_620375 [Lipomyces oligophaga]|uniref:uncharacterized protein n=1 Tax=Lipomyces oligophaga TaxID=45792 RepID=UPI0034CE9946